jgi:hypothetical protein
MANCPHCAEAFGWRETFRRSAQCGHCRLPLRIGADGKLETYASRHADEILSQAQSHRYWLLLGIGVAATLVISLVPSFGLLPLLILPGVQAICLERSVQRYREHFGLLHGLTVDFFSSLFFMVLVGVGAMANFLAGPFAALISVPMYLAAWWGYGKYCELHFRRVAAGRAPSLVELGVIGCVVGMIVLVPLLLLLTVLLSYFAGGGS